MAVDFGGDLTTGTTEELVGRNIPVGVLLGRAVKGDKTFVIVSIMIV